MSFTGEHYQKMDGKGRVSIPADFRRVLEAGDPNWKPDQSTRMVLLYGDHLKNQLQGYSVEEFDAVIAEISALPRGSVKRKRLTRYVVGQSMKLDVDRDGRTVIPIRQRQKLGITDGELFFMGAVGHFEIWKAETHKELVDDVSDEWLEEQGEDFDILSLLDE